METQANPVNFALGQTRPLNNPSATAGSGSEGPLVGSLDMLKDVPLRVTVELGRTRLFIRDILGLRQGSVVELDRPANASVDILVNGVLIARGEVVVVEERFGVRINEVVSPIPIG
jgi:flagellar motor switch protein FliN/FliY